MFWKIIKWGGTLAVIALLGFAVISADTPPDPNLPVMTPISPDNSNNKQFN